MNISRFFLPAVFLCVTVALGQNSDQPTGATQGIEVLTRGPVHEAFAETVAFDPEPGIVVPKLPPAIIQETPPKHRWEGKHADWIPGYWSWDDERADFVWVSGIWRVAPPGRQWVPGYWARAGEGAQWISGYWGDAEHSEVTYLPEPPATLEVGPSGEAPSANHTWLPGNWIWSQTRYAWRSGYWTVGQANWDWIPAHYSWTPSGYVFIDGYYDYSADRRGVLYAPVYFDPTVYNRRDYVYSPTTIINPAVFTNHLFLRPSTDIITSEITTVQTTRLVDFLRGLRFMRTAKGTNRFMLSSAGGTVGIRLGKKRFISILQIIGTKNFHVRHEPGLSNSKGSCRPKRHPTPGQTWLNRIATLSKTKKTATDFSRLKRPNFSYTRSENEPSDN